MKQIFSTTLCIASLLAGTNVYAGSGSRYDNESPTPIATLGGKIGIQGQNLDGNTPWNKKFNTGLLAGAFFGVYHKSFGGRVEANVRSVEYKNVNTGARVKIGNFDVPILFEIRPIRDLKIHIGPQFSVFPLVEDRAGNDAKRYFTSQEFSLVVGAEGDLPWHFVVGARFVKGLSDINDSYMVGNWTTTSGQFYVGYRILD